MIANISLSYSPQVHAFKPLITNAGIEYLTVAFPLTKYPGHLMVSPSACHHDPGSCTRDTAMFALQELSWQMPWVWHSM